MQRSVIQLAGKTLVVSLPSKWCKENGVKKGAKVEVDESTGHLTITSHGRQEAEKIRINITGMPSRIAWHHVRTAYTSGFHEIEIITTDKMILDQTLNKTTSISAFLQRLAQRFNGMELTQQTHTTFTLTDMTLPNPEEFNRAYNRATHIVNSMYSQEKTEPALRLDEISIYEEQLNRLVDFCERLLHTSMHLSSRTLASYLKILEGLEALGDEAKKLGQENAWATLDTLSEIVRATITSLQTDDKENINRVFTLRNKTKKDPLGHITRNVVATILNARQTLLHIHNEVGT